MTRTKPQGVLWVCIDCTIAHEHGEVPPDRPADLPEVWSLLPGTELTVGMAWEQHAEDCPNRDAGVSRDADCDCERDDFSTRACDGCGDTHHGERHAYTWWA